MSSSNGQGGQPAVDQGNSLLMAALEAGRRQAATLHTAIADTGNGRRTLLVTLRTDTATVTVPLSRADAETWAALLADGAAKLAARRLDVPGSRLILPGDPE